MLELLAIFTKLLLTLAVIASGCQCSAHQILSQNQPKYAELLNEMKDYSSSYSSIYQPCQNENGVEKVDTNIRTNNPLWNVISRMKNTFPCQQISTPKSALACKGPLCQTSQNMEAAARQFPLLGKHIADYVSCVFRNGCLKSDEDCPS